MEILFSRNLLSRRAESIGRTILSQQEIAQLIDAAPSPFYRTILMTLYATEVRNAAMSWAEQRSTIVRSA